MKVLILHHLEPMWGSGYSRFGETFDSLQEKVLDFLENNSFDKVILTRFEEWDACPSEGYFPELLHRISKVHDYAYGWESEEMENNPEHFCQGGNHSGAVLLTDWMRALKNCQVTIAGAFRGECLEDLQIALSHLGISYQEANEIIL